MPRSPIQLARRSLLGIVVAGLMGLITLVFRRNGRKPSGIRLRPPGALAEAGFLDACVRCFKCGNACPNQCIQFYGIEGGLEKAFTPYIKARQRACVLCGECGNACPSGALRPFEPTRSSWIANVEMGKARVNEAMCYSYNGRTCGACYRACPLAGQAIRIGLYETPILNPAECVGCGLCEQSCLHLPQAIRVYPSTRHG